MGWDGYTTTTVTPRASLPSDANNKPICISVVFWIIFDLLFDIITVQEGFASKVCGTDSKSIAAEDGA